MPSIPSTSICKFQQTNAPTGWTKITTYNDYALRITSSTVTTGGSRNFSAVFTNQAPTSGGSLGTVSLSVSPTVAGNQAHSHPTINNINSTTIGGGNPGQTPVTLFYVGVYAGTPGQPTFPVNVTPAGSSTAHNHPISVPAPIAAGPTAITSNANFSILYVDMIIAQRN